MATNTAPQWLKNTGVFNHSTLYLLCVIASCMLHTINVCNAMLVYKHVSVNLLIPIQYMYSLCSAHCAISHDPHQLSPESIPII